MNGLFVSLEQCEK